MAQVRCSPNISSITLTTSGVSAVSSGVLTCTALEATALCQASLRPEGNLVSTANSGGATVLALPPVVTSITINSIVYPVSGGVITGVPAADATIYLGVDFNSPFQLITG